MAIISTENIQIKMFPQKQTGKWIETRASIVYLIPGFPRAEFSVPAKNLSIYVDEVNRMLDKFASYFADLPVYSPDKQLVVKNHCAFSPMEAGFFMKFSDGEYLDVKKTNGWVTLHFDLSLRGINGAIVTDSLGCSLRIPIVAVKQFLADLKSEFRNVSL